MRGPLAEARRTLDVTSFTNLLALRLIEEKSKKIDELEAGRAVPSPEAPIAPAMPPTPAEEPASVPPTNEPPAAGAAPTAAPPSPRIGVTAVIAGADCTTGTAARARIATAAGAVANRHPSVPGDAAAGQRRRNRSNRHGSRSRHGRLRLSTALGLIGYSARSIGVDGRDAINSRGGARSDLNSLVCPR